MIRKIKINLLDFIPVLSGLIGIIALASSFAVVWSQALEITNPNFVLENVRIEILIGSIITLIAAILYPDAAPAGTLAPLVVLVPVMAAAGVHPLVLGIAVGILGIVAVKTGLFKRLVELAGFTCKTSITLAFGLSGIWMSAGKLYSFFSHEKQIFWSLMIFLILTYMVLFYYKKSWLVIPIASLSALLIPYFWGVGVDIKPVNLNLNLDPFYWWNDMWGIGFGFQMETILKTIPYAAFVLLLWTIDTVSIQTIRDTSYAPEENKEHMDIEKSFQIISIRNVIGAFLGGAQTASLWRSFLIPLYMVKRPMRICAILLGIAGIISSLMLIPIQIMSYTPMVWSVLLFGIFMPFTVAAITNIIGERKMKTKLVILLLAMLGVIISPILTWISSVIFEKLTKATEKK